MDMETKFENLKLFIEKFKTLSFWQRIFGWRHIRILSYNAYKEFNELMNAITCINKEADEYKNSNELLKNDVEHLKSENNRTETSNEILKEKMNVLTNDVSRLTNENTRFKQTEDSRYKEYEKKTATLSAIQDKNQRDRENEINEKQKVKIERLEEMKETWAKHEEKVKTTIKAICQRNIIEYVEKVPFKGKPDNTIKICGEFIIFDAKSPSSENLENFPIYIRSQIESVKKYIKEDGVRKNIFLVIPFNTVDVIDQFSHNVGDYTVYVVTIDSLEPIILSLKKIEDYEFVDQMSPEERENICRIIGKFAHMTKRKIQIDHFFSWEFLNILLRCKADLPPEILDKVLEFERSEKLNPPQERRSKQILDKDLILDNEKIQNEAEAKGIQFPDSLERDIKKIPLYEGD